jgi:hypothetical protein
LHGAAGQVELPVANAGQRLRLLELRRGMLEHFPFTLQRVARVHLLGDIRLDGNEAGERAVHTQRLDVEVEPVRRSRLRHVEQGCANRLSLVQRRAELVLHGRIGLFAMEEAAGVLAQHLVQRPSGETGEAFIGPRDPAVGVGDHHGVARALGHHGEPLELEAPAGNGHVLTPKQAHDGLDHQQRNTKQDRQRQPGAAPRRALGVANVGVLHVLHGAERETGLRTVGGGLGNHVAHTRHALGSGGTLQARNAVVQRLLQLLRAPNSRVDLGGATQLLKVGRGGEGAQARRVTAKAVCCLGQQRHIHRAVGGGLGEVLEALAMEAHTPQRVDDFALIGERTRRGHVAPERTGHDHGQHGQRAQHGHAYAVMRTAWRLHLLGADALVLGVDGATVQRPREERRHDEHEPHRVDEAAHAGRNGGRRPDHRLVQRQLGKQRDTAEQHGIHQPRPNAARNGMFGGGSTGHGNGWHEHGRGLLPRWHQRRNPRGSLDCFATGLYRGSDAAFTFSETVSHRGDFQRSREGLRGSGFAIFEVWRGLPSPCSSPGALWWPRRWRWTCCAWRGVFGTVTGTGASRSCHCRPPRTCVGACTRHTVTRRRFRRPTT